MDETGLFCRAKPSRTLAVGEPCPKLIMLTCNMLQHLKRILTMQAVFRVTRCRKIALPLQCVSMPLVQLD